MKYKHCKRERSITAAGGSRIRLRSALDPLASAVGECQGNKTLSSGSIDNAIGEKGAPSSFNNTQRNARAAAQRADA